jgi:hypothetical protein
LRVPGFGFIEDLTNEVNRMLDFVHVAGFLTLDQTNFSEALSSLKKGRPFSPSYEIKRLNATTHPVSFWISLTFLGGCISRTGFTFDGLGRMLSWLMTFPSKIPDGTPKIHFFGLSFHWYLLRVVKVRWRLSTKV